MKLVFIFVHLLLFALKNLKYVYGASCDGCIIVDSQTFDKVINKFSISLVKFDSSQPNALKQRMFEKLAKDLTSGNVMGLEDMIAIHVDVEHKNKIMNQELVSKYEIQNEIFQEKLPVIFLFARQKDADDAGKLNHFKFEHFWNSHEFRWLLFVSQCLCNEEKHEFQCLFMNF